MKEVEMVFHIFLSEKKVSTHTLLHCPTSLARCGPSTEKKQKKHDLPSFTSFLFSSLFNIHVQPYLMSTS
ncbi:unnamed protein product [Sympodiomycopsis kandeliae]